MIFFITTTTCCAFMIVVVVDVITISFVATCRGYYIPSVVYILVINLLDDDLMLVVEKEWCS